MISSTRIWGSLFLLALVAMTIAVFVLSSIHPGFHGFASMPKQTVLTLRTVLAGVSIFLFFPLIWALNQREHLNDRSHEAGITLLAFALAESPAIYGFVFFMIRGAFRTFFAFLALSIFYMFIVLLRLR